MNKNEATVRLCKAAREEADRRYDAAVKKLEAILADPQTPEEQKARLRAQLRLLHSEMKNETPKMREAKA